MARTRRPRRTLRGVSLLEAVISLTILLIGMVGMFRLQIFGMTSDEGGRSHTQALQIAHELLAGLQQLPPDDPRLDDHFTGDSPPAEFGRLLGTDGKLTSNPHAPWADDTSPAIPGVTLDADLIAAQIVDPADPTVVRYGRRWSVWMPTTPLVVDGSKLIAVSVTWRERGFPALREVVLYGTVINAAAATAFANFPPQ